MGKAINMRGKQVGRLLVIRRAGKLKNGNITWLCQCQCGRRCVVDGHLLRTGQTLSCGCIRRQSSRKLLLQNPKTREHIGDWRMLEKSWHPRTCDLRTNNQSGVTGVSYNEKQGYWIARLYFHGQYVLNQSFTDKASAIEARKKAEARYLESTVDGCGLEK